MVFIVGSILMRPPAFVRRSAGIAEAISSFPREFFGAIGFFVAAFVKSLQLDQMGHTATHAAPMTIQQALKTAAFGFIGFAFSLGAGQVALLIGSGFR
jgi:hypothetical protein